MAAKKIRRALRKQSRCRALWQLLCSKVLEFDTKCCQNLGYPVGVYRSKSLILNGLLVDLIGIEPMTSSMPWKRAPSCATGPHEEGRNFLIVSACAEFVKLPLQPGCRFCYRQGPGHSALEAQAMPGICVPRGAGGK